MKNSKRKRPARFTVGEIRKAVEIAHRNPDKVKRSSRLKRAAAKYRVLASALESPMLKASELVLQVVDAWPVEAQRLFRELESSPEAFWGDLDIEQVAQMLKAMRGRKGAPTKDSTKDRIRFAAELMLKGISQGKQAAQLFPTLEKKTAYERTRRFHSRYRRQIKDEMARLQKRMEK